MSLLFGSMMIRLMCFDSRSPTFSNVLPPSVDFQTPSPHEIDWRLFDSPVPTHTMSGFDCETVTSPIERSPRSWRIGVNETPLLVVFHTPPCAELTYQMAVFFSYTAMSAMRPDIDAGPIERKCSFSNCCAMGVGPCASPIAVREVSATHGRATRNARRIMDPPKRTSGM